MTDNEIIKALECAEGIDLSCLECSYKTVAPFPEFRLKCVKDAHDLINHQRARIKELENDIEEANIIERESEIQSTEENKENAKMFLQAIKQAKSEAIKEFAEQLKKRFYLLGGSCVVNTLQIDNLVKQMTEDESNDR